ncbi:MAG: carboxypeptidase-like regulatory domain-containing protein [Oligoflexia bacterium]|nr:carboxypeptidase-like regulatory domain-containing protein [Oligoflexia bacterium]
MSTNSMDGKIVGKMNIRDKCIRIISSSAIAGLTLSFVVGEWVDYQSQKLGKVAVDNRIYPQKILPITPIKSLVEKIRVESIENSILASNSVHEPEAVQKIADVILPQKSFDLKPLAKMAPSDMMAKAPKVVNSVSVDQINKIFDKIQTVRGAIYKDIEKTDTFNSVIVSQNYNSKDKIEKKLDLKKIEASKNENETKKTTEVSIVNGVETKNNIEASFTDRYVLLGKIIPNTTEQLLGHFEVSAFEKISSEGMPVGFPISQEILRKGVSSYKLEIPHKYRTVFLFAQYFGPSGTSTWIQPEKNPISFSKDSKYVADLYMKMEDSISSVSAAVSEVKKEAKAVEKQYIRGRVLTYFANTKAIPQSDVVVKVRGRKEAVRTNSNGYFSIPAGSFTGTIFLELLKPGYHPSILEISNDDFSKTHEAFLLSRDAASQVARKIGINQGSQKGIYIGRIKGSSGESISGASVSLSINSEGPFYFNEDGIPSRDLRKTTQDGRFVFFNVDAALGFLESTIDGESIAPTSTAFVDGGQFIYEDLVLDKTEVKGRIFSPVGLENKKGLVNIDQAKVRVVGSSDWITTDSNGIFTLPIKKWFQNKRVDLEFSTANFFNHRYSIVVKGPNVFKNLYAFPAVYIRKLARAIDLDLDSMNGIVFGKIKNRSVRVDALSDHSAQNFAKDFYFDFKGRLRGSHYMTDPRFGTFVIFNIPKGRSIINGSTKSGKLYFSDAVSIAPSTISIVLD